MAHTARILAVVAALLFSFSRPCSAQLPLQQREQVRYLENPQATTVFAQTNSMTVWRARKGLVAAMKSADKFPVKSISSIEVTESTIEFNVDSTFYDGGKVGEPYAACFRGKANIDLRTLGILSTGPNGKPPHTFYSLYLNGQDLRATTTTKSSLFEAKFHCSKQLNILGIFTFGNAAQAQSFVDSINRLSGFARGGVQAEAAEWRDFQEKAAAWRALSPKPPLPEEVRQQRVLAENAFREKNFDSAIEHYEEGLDLDPIWPEGHFNAALLYAELGQYSDAIRHMRAYLELVPDAADSRAARDQILIWQEKLRR